ncbi:MAG: IS1634 family transposase [Candidatus Micrarchaeia archaeon]
MGNYAKLLYKKVCVDSQRISDFFRKIGNEELYQNFFKEYISKISRSQNGIIIDTTSLPNQIHIPLTSWGRSGEEIDKQIRFLLVVDRKSSLPIFFRTLPGNIVDVSSLQNTKEELKQYGVKNTFVCTDAGFFSEDNIKDLYANNIDFLMRLPAVRTLYKELIHTEVVGIESLHNGVKYGKRGLFIKQKKVELFGKEVYAYIILDPKRRGKEINRLIIQTVDEKEKNEYIEYELLRKGIMILISSFEIPKKR